MPVSKDVSRAGSKTGKGSKKATEAIQGGLSKVKTVAKGANKAATKEALKKFGIELKKDSSVHWIYGKPAETFITACIFINAWQIGAEVDEPCHKRRNDECSFEELSMYFYLETFFMCVFFSEMCIKFRLEKGFDQIIDFFKSLVDLFTKPPSVEEAQLLAGKVVGVPKKKKKKQTQDLDGTREFESQSKYLKDLGENSENSDSDEDDSNSSSSEDDKDQQGDTANEGPGGPGKRYFDDFFNCFDFVIVWMSVADFVGAGKGFGALRVLRILRVVRLVRTLRNFQRLWIIVAGLVDTLKTMFWCFWLLGIFCFIAALYSTSTYGHDDTTPYYFQQYLVVDRLYIKDVDVPVQWTKDDYFGTVPRSMFTMLQVATLDKWSTHVCRPLMEHSAGSVFFLFTFITFARYGVLNVTIGTIVEATGRNVRKQLSTVNQLVKKAEEEVLAGIERGILKLADENDCLDKDALLNHFKKPPVKRSFGVINLNMDDAKELYEACAAVEMDQSSVSASRYCQGVHELKGDATSFQCLKLLKLTTETDKIALSAAKSATRQADLIENISMKIADLEYNVYPKVPEVPEHLAKQVKKNLALVQSFFKSIFGVVKQQMEVEKGRWKLVEVDKLMAWLKEQKYLEEKEDLKALRAEYASLNEVREMLELRGRLDEWLRKFGVKLITLEGLDAWVKDAKRYLREEADGAFAYDRAGTRPVSAASGMPGAPYGSPPYGRRERPATTGSMAARGGGGGRKQAEARKRPATSPGRPGARGGGGSSTPSDSDSRSGSSVGGGGGGGGRGGGRNAPRERPMTAVGAGGGQRKNVHASKQSRPQTAHPSAMAQNRKRQISEHHDRTKHHHGELDSEIYAMKMEESQRTRNPELDSGIFMDPHTRDRIAESLGVRGRTSR